MILGGGWIYNPDMLRSHTSRGSPLCPDPVQIDVAGGLSGDDERTILHAENNVIVWNSEPWTDLIKTCHMGSHRRC